jgi:predicted HTH domain antitoxin
MGKTVKVSLELPDGVSDQARESAEHRAREAVVLALWERQELTIREAAAELGLGYAAFLDLLAARGIPVAREPLDLEVIEKADRKLAGELP